MLSESQFISSSAKGKESVALLAVFLTAFYGNIENVGLMAHMPVFLTPTEAQEGERNNSRVNKKSELTITITNVPN